MRKILNRGTAAAVVALLVVLIVCLTFAWATNDAMAHLVFQRQGKPGPAANGEHAPVDLRPWQTARVLAGLAVTAEETEFAREAERLADHEIDQAFALALRQASSRQPVLTGEALELSKKLTALERAVKDDQAAIEKLTAAGANATDDLEVAKAQLDLDSDEFADAQQDLARATGDERNRIQQELAGHEAAMREYSAKGKKEGDTAVTTAEQYGSVVRRLAAWINQNSRYQLIQQAAEQASAEAAVLMARHRQMEQQQAQAKASSVASAAADKDTRLAGLKRRATTSQMMAIYDDRIQTEQQLAAVYGKWSAQVLLQHRIVFHLLMQSFALMAGVLICILLLNTLVRYLLDRSKMDHRRAQTWRVIFRVGVQFVGAAALLLIIFGVPNQMPAILGLTTAGLTVVLQDFIIAFFGWVVLMGKNGIHVGDWVEINGVGGEVVQIGLFRTALLETGNWTDKGHPTGRRVTFLNSFAIKGQYFNFSTAGQWMWDQIAVTVPAADDTYATIEQICKAVMKETEADAKLAEQEWQRVNQKDGANHFTAGLSVDMRPSAAGVDMVVHYVTRAADRFEVRNRLYQCMIGLLHKPLGDAGSINLPVAL